MSSLAQMEMWIWSCYIVFAFTLHFDLHAKTTAAKVERGRRNLLRRLPEFETTWQLFTHVPSPAHDGMLWGDTVVQRIQSGAP